jgi:DNA repair protein RecO (recombination protein O)
MLQNTKGIVLRSVKYGETSLIAWIFTQNFGVQTYLVQGVRSSKAKNRAALFQPASLLELVAYQKPQKSLQRLREFQSAYLAASMQEEVIKNITALFSVEFLFRLLPEHAPMPELFEFTYDYFKSLDQMLAAHTPNFPLYFIIQSSRLLGYEVQGSYCETTPHLNLHEGGFSAHSPAIRPFVSDEDAIVLAQLIQVKTFSELKEITMNGTMRFRLLDWYMEYLHQHCQHLGQIKSLSVLRQILH